MASVIDRLEHFVAQAPNATAMFDREMRYLAVSARWVADYGLNDAPLGRSHYAVFPEIGDRVRAVHRRCLAGATESSDGDRFERADGSVQWVSWEARPWTDGDGAIGGIVIASVDVTARVEAQQRAEDAARRAEAAEQRLKDAIEVIPNGFAIYDPQDRLVVHNEAGAAMYPDIVDEIRPGASFEHLLRAGYDRGHWVLGVTDKEAWIKERMKRHRNPSGAFEQLTNAGRCLRIEERRMSDGGTVIIRTDVTELKNQRRELAEKTALLEATLQDTGEGIAVFGPDRRLLLHNDLAAKLLDMPSFEPGASFEQIIRFRAARGDYGDIDADAFVRGLVAQFDARTPWTRTRRQRSGRVTEIRFNPMPDGGGILMYRDVTERADFEARLSERTDLLEATLENMGEGIAVFGPDLTLLTFNQNAAQLVDIPPELSRTGVSYEDLTRYCAARGDYGDIDVEACVRERTAQFRAQRRPWSRTLAIRDGCTIETRFNPMPDGGGVYVYRDVTERERAEARIREEEAKFRSLVEQDVAGIVIVREDGTIGYCNGRYASMLGYEPAELLGREPLDFVTESDRSEARRLRLRLFRSDAPFQIALTLRARDGRAVEALVNASRSTFEGRPAAIGVIVDVTERNRAQRDLASTAERFRMLIEEAPDAILLYDYDHDRVVAANRAAERLFGVPRETLLERGPRPFYGAQQPDARPAPESFEEHNLRALAGEQVDCERRILRPSGEERLCRVTLVRLESKVRLLRGSFVDITDQAAAEAKLSEVLRTLVVSHEAERQRIARELHDSLGQYLAAANMKLETFSQKLGALSPLSPGVAELKDLTGTIASEVSRLAWELRPIALDDLGLEPVIRRFVDEWARRSGLRFDVHVAVNGRLPPDVETALFRVLQESVTNVVRHAQAGTVGVVLKSSSKEAVMIVEDNGVGFDLDIVSRTSHRLGLLGIRERLAAIGGAIEIETRPGQGTTLIARAPLDDRRAAP